VPKILKDELPQAAGECRILQLLCLGNITTNGARCTCGIRSRTGMPKAALNKKNTFCTRKLWKSSEIAV
jgi:hypothetical protein